MGNLMGKNRANKSHEKWYFHSMSPPATQTSRLGHAKKETGRYERVEADDGKERRAHVRL